MTNASHPSCFPSEHAYLQWAQAAARAKEEASPCEDCSAQYEQRMTTQERCSRITVREHFTTMTVRRGAQKATP